MDLSTLMILKALQDSLNKHFEGELYVSDRISKKKNGSLVDGR